MSSTNFPSDRFWFLDVFVYGPGGAHMPISIPSVLRAMRPRAAPSRRQPRMCCPRTGRARGEEAVSPRKKYTPQPSTAHIEHMSYGHMVDCTTLGWILFGLYKQCVAKQHVSNGEGQLFTHMFYRIGFDKVSANLWPIDVSRHLTIAFVISFQVGLHV